MVKNKRRGFMLIELLIGMVLSALLVLAISKASFISNSISAFSVFGDNIQTQITIKEILFRDIKSADTVMTKDRSVISIYKDDAIIVYQIKDGDLMRNNECLRKNLSGYFDMVNNTIEVVISDKDFDMQLNIQAGLE